MFSLKSLLILLIAILFIHVLATVNYWYWKYTWVDVPMHFLGGFWVAAFFAYLIFPKLQIIDYKFLITLILFVSFAALVGIFWEFYEFFYDIFISAKGFSGIMQMNAADTLADLLFDLLGGLLAGAIYLFKERKI